MYYAGIDLGTSAVKLLLMDEKGTIIRIVSREYPIYFPHPGWSSSGMVRAGSGGLVQGDCGRAQRAA